MADSQNPSFGSLSFPGPLPTQEGYKTVTTITNGDAVVADYTVFTYSPTTYYGVKTSPTTADNPRAIGIAQFPTVTGQTTVVGTTGLPVDCIVVTKGLVYKAKCNAAVAEGDSLVIDSAATGQVKTAGASDVSYLGWFAATAAGTLIDGTTAAGFCSVIIR